MATSIVTPRPAAGEYPASRFNAAAKTEPAGSAEPTFNGYTARQIDNLLSTIAMHAQSIHDTLRMVEETLADNAEERGNDPALGPLELSATTALIIGALADAASGLQFRGDMMHWLCGPLMERASPAA